MGATDTVKMESAVSFGGGVTWIGSKAALTPAIGFLMERLTGALKSYSEVMSMEEVSELPCGMVNSSGEAAMEKSGSGGGLFDAQTSQIVPLAACMIDGFVS